MKTPKIIAITILGLLGTTASSAHAEDWKTYHGSQCHSINGIDSDYNRSEYRVTRSFDTGSGDLMCPVIRDTFDCGWGGCVQQTVVEVSVLDHHTGNNGTITCSFSARNETGSATYYDSDDTSAVWGWSNDTLVMSTPGWPPNEGAYALKCSLPVNSGSNYAKLFSYVVKEAD